MPGRHRLAGRARHSRNHPIGGEAYLRKDWTQLIKAIHDHGMYCAIQTGGRNLTPAKMQAAVDAGLDGVGISLDGLAPLHDAVRNVPGSFDKAVDTLRRAKAAGLAVSVNTQIGAATLPDLPALMDTIIELGATTGRSRSPSPWATRWIIRSCCCNPINCSK
jgi:MoaA/NifB/PqqE/SkfB family radical SAM enzyme